MPSPRATRVLRCAERVIARLYALVSRVGERSSLTPIVQEVYTALQLAYSMARNRTEEGLVV